MTAKVSNPDIRPAINRMYSFWHWPNNFLASSPNCHWHEPHRIYAMISLIRTISSSATTTVVRFQPLVSGLLLLSFWASVCSVSWVCGFSRGSGHVIGLAVLVRTRGGLGWSLAVSFVGFARVLLAQPCLFLLVVMFYKGVHLSPPFFDGWLFFDWVRHFTFFGSSAYLHFSSYGARLAGASVRSRVAVRYWLNFVSATMTRYEIWDVKE